MRRHRLRNRSAFLLVRVPRLPAQEHLNETHASFDQTLRQQTAAAVLRCARVIEAVESLRLGGLAADVQDFRHGRLHAGGQFVTGQTGLQLRTGRVPFEVGGVQLAQQLKLVAAGSVRQAGGGPQVSDGGAAGAERRSLVAGRQEAGGPVAGAIDGQAAGIAEDDVGRQFLADAAQTVNHPRPPDRPALKGLARVDHAQGRLVIDRFGLHRADQRQLVGDPRRVWQQLREVHPRPAVFAEAEGRCQQLARLCVEVDLQPAGVLLSVAFAQFRLGIEQVHLAGAAVLEQADDGAGRWPMVRRLRGEGAAGPLRSGPAVPGKEVSHASGPRLPAERARNARRVNA